MKMRNAVLALVLLCVPLGLSAQVRFDVGFDIPRGIGAVAENQVDISQETVDFFNDYVFPFPEAGVYYQQEVDPFRIGCGLRAYTFILETVFWPNFYAETDLWRFTFALQAGGGLFGFFGLYNDFQAGAIFIPDLSAWFRIGKSFRLGAGAIGFMNADWSDSLVFAYYFGLKFAITS